MGFSIAKYVLLNDIKDLLKISPILSFITSNMLYSIYKILSGTEGKAVYSQAMSETKNKKNSLIKRKYCEEDGKRGGSLRQPYLSGGGRKEKKVNMTGIPAQLKERFETSHGCPLDDVRVHYHSSKPADLNALAYTKGNHVYLGPGNEDCLVHEMGHVIQQKRGGIHPTRVILGQPVNDDPRLEREADQIGKAKGFQFTTQRRPEGEDVIQCLMTSQGFRNSTRSYFRRGTSNGRYYRAIEPLLDEYQRLNEAVPAAPDAAKMSVLKILEDIVLRWREERPDQQTVRAQARTDLLADIQNEKNQLIVAGYIQDQNPLANQLPGQEQTRKQDVGELFTRPDGFTFNTDNKSIIDIINLLNHGEKARFWQYLDRIIDISTQSGIRKAVIGASENVFKLYQFLNFHGYPLGNRDELIGKFLQRFNLITAYILDVAQTLIPDGQVSYGQIYYIDSTGSDPHVRGKHALYLVSKITGERTGVYKPHDMGADQRAAGVGGVLTTLQNLITLASYQNFIQGLADPHDMQQIPFTGIGFATMNIQPVRQTEDYMTKVDQMTGDQAKLYFFNAGMLETAAKVYHFVDLHQENIMPVFIQNHNSFAPQIIDAECSFVEKQDSGLNSAMTCQAEDKPSVFTISDRQGHPTAGSLYQAEFRVFFDLGQRFLASLINNNPGFQLASGNILNGISRIRFLPYSTEGWMDYLNLGIGNPIWRANKIAEILNSLPDIMNVHRTFFFRENGLFAYVHHGRNRFRHKLADAAQNGTIPAFEFDFRPDGACRVLCDAPPGAYPDNCIIGEITRLPGHGHGSILNMLQEHIRGRAQNVNDLILPPDHHPH